METSGKTSKMSNGLMNGAIVNRQTAISDSVMHNILQSRQQLHTFHFVGEKTPFYFWCSGYNHIADDYSQRVQVVVRNPRNMFYIFFFYLFFVRA